MTVLRDYQGDELKRGQRVLAAVAVGRLQEGLIVGYKDDGRIVVQLGVSILVDNIVIPASGCIRIPHE